MAVECMAAMTRRKPRKQSEVDSLHGKVAESKRSLTVRLTKEAMQIVLSEAAKHGVSLTSSVEMIIRSFGRDRSKPKN